MDRTFAQYFDLVMASAKAAWQRMVRMLFKPFDIEKWFILGFVAWLATLGEQGGGGGGGRIFNAFPDHNKGGAGNPQFRHVLESILTWCREHILLICVIGVVILTVLLVVWLVTLWLSSRAKFMFLHDVIRDQALLADPWREYRAEGHSLFRWRIGFTLAVLFLVLILVALLLGIIFGLKAPLAVKITLGIGVGLIFLAVIVAATLIARFLEDFVLLIMYRYRLTATAAWVYFARLARCYWKGFVAYVLALIVLSIIAGLAVLAAFVATCCVACCIAMLPYLGTVLMLPVLLFFRLFSVYFFQGLHPEFVMLADDAVPPLVPTPEPTTQSN